MVQFLDSSQTDSFWPVGPGALALTALLIALPGTLPSDVRYWPLLASVVVLGLPHGAVDHLSVRTLRPSKAKALLPVALLYAVTGSVYFFVWLYAPLLAVVLFLLLTWIHWGQGDLYHLRATAAGRHLDTKGRRLFALVVRGGVPMIVPLLTFPDTYRRVLTTLARVLTISPAIPYWLFSIQTRVALGVGFITLTLLALAWSWAGVETSEERTSWRTDAGETLMLWVFFLIVPPILAIGVYFTCWHSLRYIRRVVALDKGPSQWAVTASGGPVAAFNRRSIVRFGRAATPNTLGALLLVAFISLVGTADGGLLAITGRYLVAVAVLTLPHTAVVTWMDARQRLWAVDDTSDA